MENSSLPRHATSIDLDKLRSEARARVHWGETRDQVCLFLEENGIASPAARAIVAEFVGERHTGARLRGVLQIVGGTLGASTCGGILYGFHAGWIPTIPAKAWAILLLGTVIGLGAALDGVVRLMFGAHGERLGT